MKNLISSMPWGTRVSAILLLIIVGAAILADPLSTHNPNATELGSRNAPAMLFDPSSGHLLGADELGRDLYSRLLHGTRTSLLIAVVGLVLGGVIGTIMGLTAGYFGGVWDRLVMLAVNFQQSIPLTLLLLLGLVVFGRGILVLMIFIGLAGWETYARVVRGLALSLRERPFIEASRSYGASSARIIWKHLLPNTMSHLVVLLVLNFPLVLLLESGLSFIGIGVQPPTATLGQMVGDGRNYLATQPMNALVPSVVIVLLGFCVYVLGDWLRNHTHVQFERR